MAATCETSSVTTFFDQATSAFGEALKGGVKFQEQVAGYWTVVDANYKRSVDLLKKACEGTSAVNPADLQAKTQSLFEAAVEVVKENTTALAQANLKVLELWADVLRQNGAPVAPVVVPGVKSAK